MGKHSQPQQVIMNPADSQRHRYSPTDPDLKEGSLPAPLGSWRCRLASKSSFCYSDSNIQNVDNAAKADEACAPDTGKYLEYKIWGRGGKTSFLRQTGET